MVRGQGPGGEAVLTWAQAREMQQSGLVEFASHGYDLHGTVRGNPQASQVPAFWFRIFDPARGYEDDDAYRRRVGADLQQSIAVMTRELGRAPRAIAWPYGRYTQSAVEIARGSRLSLRPDVRSGAGPGEPPARDREVLALHRIAAAAAGRAAAGRRHAAARSAVRPASPVIVVAAGSRRDRAPARCGHRACPDPGRHRHRDRRGRAGTGRTSCGVVPDESDTRPRRRLPAVRVAISDSSGCAGVGRLPAAALDLGRRRARGHLPRLRHLHLRGRSSGRRGQRAGGAWRRRLRRAVGGRSGAARHRRGSVAAAGATSPDLLQGRATRTAGSSARVGLTDTPDPRGPGAAADITFVRTAPDPGEAGRAIDAMVRAGWLSPRLARRVGLWLESDRPPADRDLMAITRRFQREGGVALGWSSDDPVADQPSGCRRRPGRVGEPLPSRGSDRCGTSSSRWCPASRSDTRS